jgi:flagellar motor component MotA
LKKSFAMLFAIIFIVVLATVGTLMMYFSASNVKKTSNEYLSIQAQMKAREATEYAIMALQARDFKNDGCINKIDINSTLYDVNMTFHYFLKDCNLKNCNNICSTITTQESNGSVMINTYVTSKVDSNVRFFRQTIQKP